MSALHNALASHKRAALLLLLTAACLWLVASRGRAPAAVRVHASTHETACHTLEARLCKDLDACALARERLQGASDARCQGMLARYAQVASELGDLADGVAELRAREQRTAHFAAPQLGPTEAELSFVLFCDFQSEACGRLSPLARSATQLAPDRVRIVYRHAPRSPEGRLAAQASVAAHAQGKFWPYYDVLYANPHDHSRAALERYAAAAGLDLPAFRSALDAQLYAADVDYDRALARRLQAVELPSLFLNGKPVSVPYGMAELTALIDGAQRSE